MLSVSALSNIAFANRVEMTDTLHHYVLHFKQKSSVIDTGYVSNGSMLNKINMLLNKKNDADRIKSISITASSSPEGVYEYNIFLASKRTKVIKSYLLWKHPELKKEVIELHNNGENWDGLYEIVSGDENIPGKEKVMEIIKQDINPGTKKWRLQQVANGDAWKYMEKYLFKKLRTAQTEITILIEKEKETELPVIQKENTDSLNIENNKNITANNINDSIKTTAKTDSVQKDTLINKPQEETVQKEKQSILALKTNLAAYVFGVANLAVEVPFAKKFSVDIPVYYSPYTLAQNYKFRILALEPELKYWFKQPFKGHAIGIHGAAVMYNIAFNDRDRFQNTNGENFVYGGGISYGYTMNLKKNWNIEFTAGFGYLHLDHDVFRNVDNGALYDNRTFHYWGPTKLGVNIIYLFNK